MLKTSLRSLGVLFFLLLPFQNCGRVNLANTASLENMSQSVPFVDISQYTLLTTVNQPVEMKITKSVADMSISLEQNDIVTTQEIPNAQVILDLEKPEVTVTPAFGFRGTTQFTLYSKYQNITKVQNITVIVQNPSLDFSPTLAVRGSECILCHASLKGDLITDFGYKGTKDTGRDLFFAARPGPGQGTSPYAPAHSGSRFLATATITGSVVVPTASMNTIDTSSVFRFFPYTVSEQQSLKQYVDMFERPLNASYSGTVEAKEIYIGSPAKEDILKAGNLTSTIPMRFFKNSAADQNLTSFKRFQEGDKDYYTNDRDTVMVCEGDLLVDGVVHLDHLKLQTATGCRIYATRSVFISGPIQYVNEKALTNLEITSAIGVYSGFGYCVDCADADSFNYKNRNTLLARYQDHLQHYIPNFRSETLEVHMAETETDAKKVSNFLDSLPPAPPTGADAKTYYKTYLADRGVTLIDGTNSFMGEEGTGYERVLFNARDVQSRYVGDVHGIVIAEFAMWRLGSFKFVYEPVFTGVPLLPFLNFDKILKVDK